MSEWRESTPSATDAGEVTEIEGKITRTQGEMSGTLDAIQEKLNPGALMEQARGPVEEMGDHLIARITTAAEEATDHILEQARATATEAASDIVARTGEAVRAATIGKVEHMVQTVGNTTSGSRRKQLELKGAM